MNKIGKLRNGESENFNFNLKVGTEQQLAVEVWEAKSLNLKLKGWKNNIGKAR